MELNKFENKNCMDEFKNIQDNYFNLTLTDIPYDEVDKKDNGLRVIDKGIANALNFDLNQFLEEVYRVTNNTIIIFCGKEQFSYIYGFFAKKKGTVRSLIWEKTNPSPMNGQHIYLSGVEHAVWFKKRGAKTFNAHCKNTVFKFPNGRSKIHPTEKNHKLLEELIKDNSNPGDVIFDPCAGSASTLLVAKKMDRKYIGYEINIEYYSKAIDRLYS